MFKSHYFKLLTSHLGTRLNVYSRLNMRGCKGKHTWATQMSDGHQAPVQQPAEGMPSGDASSQALGRRSSDHTDFTWVVEYGSKLDAGPVLSKQQVSMV